MITLETIDTKREGPVDLVEQHDETGGAFYDLFAPDGTCLNEGTPFYERPTPGEILAFVDELPS